MEEEVDFDLAAGGDVAEGAGAVVVEPEEGRLCIGVPEEHSEVVALVLALNHDEVVDTVDLLATYAGVVGTVLSLSPHSPGTFS